MTPEAKAKLTLAESLTETFKPHGLFTTPNRGQDIHDWIEMHNQANKIHLYTVWGMTHNLACASIQEQIAARQELEAKAQPDQHLLKMLQACVDQIQAYSPNKLVEGKNATFALQYIQSHIDTETAK